MSDSHTTNWRCRWFGHNWCQCIDSRFCVRCQCKQSTPRQRMMGNGSIVPESPPMPQNYYAEKVVKLNNDSKVPEIAERKGSVNLNFNYDNRETVEIEGSITISEVCFLQKCLDRWIMDNVREDPEGTK